MNQIEIPAIGPIMNLANRIQTWLQIRDNIPHGTTIVFIIPGTGHPNPTKNYRTNFPKQIADLLDTNKYAIWGIAYPASLAFRTSVNGGVRVLTTAINSLDPGQDFVLIGYSQGAMIASQVLKDLQSGKIKNRLADLKATVVLGNPCRKAGVIFPGGTDPGGHGIADAPKRLTTIPSGWWEFANVGDLAATPGDDTVGLWCTALFMAFWSDLGNILPTIKETMTDAENGGIDLTAYLNELLSYVTGDPTSAHGQYDTYKPISGNNKTSIQLAADYLNGL
jgi:pimeloyl-ACP methyl ester carboxylesterase